MKQIRSRPSHSRKSMSGKGFFGSMRTMLLYTFGGGLKLFLPTLIKWSTFESNCTFTLNLQYRSEPGLAVNLWANYFWNMSTAHLNIGFCASNLKTRGELIWYGMLATHMSKKGSYTARTSPGISVNLLAFSEYLNLLESSATMRGSISMAMTFLALSRRRAVKLPVPGPISSTTSVGLMADLTTISLRMCELMRMCCPYDLLKTMPVRLTVCFSFIMNVDDYIYTNTKRKEYKILMKIDKQVNQHIHDMSDHSFLASTFVLGLKIRKDRRMYPLSAKALKTEYLQSISSATSTKAVARREIFPKTTIEQVISERLPVDFTLWIQIICKILDPETIYHQTYTK